MRCSNRASKGCIHSWLARPNNYLQTYLYQEVDILGLGLGFEHLEKSLIEIKLDGVAPFKADLSKWNSTTKQKPPICNLACSTYQAIKNPYFLYSVSLCCYFENPKKSPIERKKSGRCLTADMQSVPSKPSAAWVKFCWLECYF